MTFSIVAHDPGSASWGVAVASKCLAVGSAVPWGRAGAGAVATQGLANLAYGPDGLEMLARGEPAAAAVQRLTGPDAERDQRQVGVVDAEGDGASFTGARCLPWAGGAAGRGLVAQGNLLAGPEVIQAMVAAYRSAAGQPFAGRLLAALRAGEGAGGDRRGRQSAALRVWRAGGSYGGGADVAVDLRVDDHADPVGELARLVDLQELYFGRPDPATLLPLEGALAGQVGEVLATLGYDPAAKGGLWPALEEWSGVENFEERTVPGRLDPVVWEILRARAGRAPGGPASDGRASDGPAPGGPAPGGPAPGGEPLGAAPGDVALGGVALGGVAVGGAAADGAVARTPESRGPGGSAPGG
jgi:uncharacterized Ntn-hydrolase superfamily protein